MKFNACIIWKNINAKFLFSNSFHWIKILNFVNCRSVWNFLLKIRLLQENIRMCSSFLRKSFDVIFIFLQLHHFVYLIILCPILQVEILFIISLNRYFIIKKYQLIATKEKFHPQSVKHIPFANYSNRIFLHISCQHLSLGQEFVIIVMIVNIPMIL